MKQITTHITVNTNQNVLPFHFLALAVMEKDATSALVRENITDKNAVGISLSSSQPLPTIMETTLTPPTTAAILVNTIPTPLVPIIR